jgi:hypothetical protein
MKAGSPQKLGASPQLGRALWVTRQGIQRIVDEAKQLGYVEARANPGHKRSHLIALTGKGGATYRDVHDAALARIDQLAAPLPPRTSRRHCASWPTWPSNARRWPAAMRTSPPSRPDERTNHPPTRRPRRPPRLLRHGRRRAASHPRRLPQRVPACVMRCGMPLSWLPRTRLSERRAGRDSAAYGSLVADAPCSRHRRLGLGGVRESVATRRIDGAHE